MARSDVPICVVCKKRDDVRIAAYHEGDKTLAVSWRCDRCHQNFFNELKGSPRVWRHDRPPQQNSKMRNRREVIDGLLFDSYAEGYRYRELAFMQANTGRIENLQMQVPFELVERVTTTYAFNHKPSVLSPVYYRADFVYYDADLDRIVVEDVKGQEQALWRLKWHLLARRLSSLERVILHVYAI